MENNYNSQYRKNYIQGYTFGLLPVFNDCEDVLKFAPHCNNKAFVLGFEEGRFEYEKLNGNVDDGIPSNIITEGVLANFFLEGKLGMPINTDGYTHKQCDLIREYYRSGSTYYEPNFDSSLCDLLVKTGIDRY